MLTQIKLTLHQHQNTWNMHGQAAKSILDNKSWENIGLVVKCIKGGINILNGEINV